MSDETTVPTGDERGLSAPSHATADYGRGLAHPTAWPIWATTTTVVLVTLVGDVGTAGIVLFLASLAVFGLPHGAVDHLVVARLRENGSLVRSLAVVGVGYLVLGSLYALVWFVAPVVGFVSFLLLTWYHWGQGDLQAVVAGRGRHLRTHGQCVLTLVVRGGLPMVVPLLAFPGEYRAVLTWTVGLFDPAAAESVGWLFAADVRLALGVGFAAVALASLGLGWRRATTRQTTRDWLHDAGETGLLAAYFALVPPLVAIGVYFALWHSLRHVLRVTVLDDVAATALADDRPWTALGRFARDATPLSLAALVVAGGLFVLVPNPSVDPAGLVGLTLVFLAVLTLPHTVVTTWADVRQGVWHLE